MSPLELLNLFAAMTLLALIPSTSIALVVSRASTKGFANGAAATAGIVLGDLVFIMLALLGLSALAEAMGELFLILRYLAGGYLILWGINLLRSKPAPPHRPAGAPLVNLSTSFIAGLMLTLGDVKAILFYASLFPAFIDVTTLSAVDISWIIFITLIALGGIKLGYAYGAQKITSLSGGSTKTHIIQRATGGVMITAGGYLIMKA